MNKAELIGRFSRDPELRTTSNGVANVQFTLAVDREFKNQNGERDTDWITCEAWRQQAELISKYFHKGSRIGIVGSIRTGSYEKDGRKVYTTTVVVEKIDFIDSASSNNKGSSSTQSAPKAADAPTFEDDDTGLPFDL